MAKLKVLYRAIDPYYSDCIQTFIGETLSSCEDQMFEHNEWRGRNHPNGIYSIYETKILTEEE